LALAQAGLLLYFVFLLQQVFVLLTPTSVLSATAEMTQALWLTGLIALTVVVLGVLRAIEFSLCEEAGYEVVRRLRMEMYGHLQRMTPGQLRTRARGGLLLRLIGDLSMLRMWLSRGALLGISSAIILIISCAAAIWTNTVMGFVLVAMLCLGAMLSLTVGHAMRDATREMRQRRSLVIGNIDEQINALDIVQMAGRSRGEYARLSRQNDDLTSALVHLARLRAVLRGLALASGLLATTAVLAVGVVLVYQDQTTVAVLVAEITLSRFVTRPVRTLGLAHDYWHRGQVSKQKIQEFLASSARPAKTEQLPRLQIRRGDIEFDGVCVPGFLDGFTASAGKGQIVAIVGAPGSGASTVLEIVARLVDPVAGTLRIDGQDVMETSPWSTGTKIGYYRSDLLLMRGTVGRNLTYAMPDADPTEVERLVLALGIDELLTRFGPRDQNPRDLKDGLKVLVTEGGRNLAPHDRNLIAFARALMGNPRILLLGESLAGLHPDDRDAARRLLLRHPGTVLWHTSEPEDLADADQIWFIESGRVARTSTGSAYTRERWEESRR
jgi:ATP-binding cassette subfamily B protein